MFDTIKEPHILQPVLEQGWTLIELPISWADKAREVARERIEQNQLRPAKLSINSQVNQEIRNDFIFWLDPQLNQLNSFETDLLNRLENWVHTLKEFFLMPLSEVECHWAFYPKNHFYLKHKDTTSASNKRQLSFVLYLNDNWKPSDEGELQLHLENGPVKIKPKLGHLILFRSDVEHEVLKTNADRLSLTGWIRSP